MNKRKTVLKITLALACFAAVLWVAAGCQDPDYQCGTESMERANKTREVFLKYKHLFRRQPNNPIAREEFLRNEKTGERTETWGIVVTVDGEKVDQDTLPPKDRIPDEIEGVPIQVISWQIAEKAPSFLSGYRPDADPELLLVRDVIRKNSTLFKRHPFYQGISWTTHKADNRAKESILGIEVYVTKIVDQSTLPQEDRIPDCIEDVPVTVTLTLN